MSGQRETASRRGSGMNVPAVDPQARISTGLAERAPGQYRTDRSSLAAIGNALDGFFKAAGQTVDNIAEVEHREDLVQIRRDNEQREIKAAADALEGKPMDEADAEYFSYFNAYSRTNAQVTARRALQRWQDKVREAPVDFDYDTEFEAFRKEVYGDSGLQDPTYNAAFLSTLSAGNEQIRHNFKTRQFHVQVENANNEFVDRAIGMVGSGDFDAINAAVLRKEAVAMNFGDESKARAVMAKALTGGIVNRGQAESVLVALEDSGIRASDPDLYLAVSSVAEKRIRSTVTTETYEQLDKLQAKVYQLVYNPQATPEDYGNLVTEVAVSAMKYGGEDGHKQLMGTLIESSRRAFKVQANINRWINAYTEGQGFSSVIGSLDEEGKPISRDEFVNKHFASGVSQIIASNEAMFPELARTAQRTGAVDPLATRGAGREFVDFITSPRFVKSTPEAIPPQYRDQFTQALEGADVQAAEKAYYVVKGVRDRLGEPYAMRLLGSDTAKQQFLDIQRATATNPGISPATFLDARSKANGNAPADSDPKPLSLPKLKEATGKSSPEEAMADVRDKIHTAIADHLGLENWLGWNHKVAIPDERLEGEIIDRAYRSWMAEQRRGGKTDFGEFVKDAVKTASDSLLPLPTQAKGRQLIYRNPYKGDEGRIVGKPLNTVNGVDVYLPSVVALGPGHQEDLRKKTIENLELIKKAFPETPWAEGIGLGAPDMGGARGLFPLVDKSGDAVMLAPGQKLKLKVGGKDLDVMLPDDVTEARKVIDQHLGDLGVFAVPFGATGQYGRPVLQLSYGARLEKSRAWAEKTLKEKEAKLANTLQQEPKRREMGQFIADHLGKVQPFPVIPGPGGAVPLF